ncbi:MAG: AAA family ATPase [Halanaerobiales bacterium]|nr:AAA family ATPase [Halanaerobiales bacterium]
MEQLINLIHEYGNENWSERSQNAFAQLFGSEGGRYRKDAQKVVSFRTPESTTIPFASIIHKSNPDSGLYGGMSFVIFPVSDAPSLIAMVVGKQGLSPDEEVLARPGHGRKVKAICSWLNKKYGKGKMVAWAKQDPVRIDMDIPSHIKKLFLEYDSVFKKYGKVIYGFFVPLPENIEVTSEALKAFLDLTFEERGYYPLSSVSDESEKIRLAYFSHLMNDFNKDEVLELLRDRRFVVLEGPPGTGKTRMALQILKNAYNNNGFSVQFHPNTTYENFVGGLAPVSTTDGMGFRFEPKKGFLMEAIEGAVSNPSKLFLLHIDEINRADLSKVLGEAIFLFEANAEINRSINLPYDFGGSFESKLELPDNLHILGTMNSTDRSIAIVDVAVRRRFAFVKLWPQMRVVQEHSDELMQKAYRELLSIFIEYASDEGLELIPGHSYFLEKDDKKAARSLKVNLAPLLEEYLSQGYVAGFSEPIRSYLQWIESL